MVTRRPQGAEGVVGTACEHGINGSSGRSNGAQGRFQRARRHHCIGVHILNALVGCHGKDVAQVLFSMSAKYILFLAQGCQLPLETGKVRSLEDLVDHLDAIHPFGMSVRCQMVKRGGMAEKKGIHCAHSMQAGFGKIVQFYRDLLYRAPVMDISNEILLGASALLGGELVAFPTETVYGLGADATSDKAVARLYAAKGRPSFNPLISHVADAGAAFVLGRFPDQAKALAARFWPGPLTIVVPRAANCPVSLLATAGLSSLALRVPDHALTLELLKAVQRPVVAPSANPSGRISPTTAEHVRAGLGDKLAVIIDGGPCEIGVESSVVSFVDHRAKLLRHGGLARDVLEQALGHRLDVELASQQPHSPGQMESHYAPHAQLRLNAELPQAGETFLGFGKHCHGPYTLSKSGDVVEAAANLFRLLHELDDRDAATIAVAPIPNEGLGEAINDRLRRAAAPRLA